MGKTLLEHAAYELTKSGFVDDTDPENRKVATDVMALVRRFVKQDHNERTGRIVLDFFETICFFLPLTPITDDPEEWEKFEIKTTNQETGEETTSTRWQSKRAPRIISEDSGKTFIDQATGKTGESVNAAEYAKKVEEQKALRDKTKAEQDNKKATEKAEKVVKEQTDAKADA